MGDEVKATTDEYGRDKEDQYRIVEQQFLLQHEAANRLLSELSLYSHQLATVSATRGRIHMALRDVMAASPHPLLAADAVNSMDFHLTQYVHKVESAVGVLGEFMDKVQLVESKMAEREALYVEWKQLNDMHPTEEEGGMVNNLEQYLRLQARCGQDVGQQRTTEAKKELSAVNNELMIELPALHRARLHYVSRCMLSVQQGEAVMEKARDPARNELLGDLETIKDITAPKPRLDEEKVGSVHAKHNRVSEFARNIKRRLSTRKKTNKKEIEGVVASEISMREVGDPHSASEDHNHNQETADVTKSSHKKLGFAGQLKRRLSVRKSKHQAEDEHHYKSFRL